MHKPFSIVQRWKSFTYAGKGFFTMLISQHNAWIHALSTVLVIFVGIIWGISRLEWCWIILAIMAVWTAEALNTALEFLADAITPQYHPLVEKAKDVAAGAVLISAIGSVVIAALVLGPHLLEKIN
ncbi:diacylglycerol kinase family protein [candidate division KSB1 bacterium]|nr:diacylglycerol kinase family protein [candidate division KSB1 bacterium]